ncbi:hypothetical protein CPB84DRAFT_1789768 [Gymnopilus junonius]|uniref:G domain-containing protein n=1 Tax=Gymnopilus junonius TaxID=109634 RepID=A0A9P5NDG7_GYMJU|nr:hypothetical protein CPB84DRAFT_1789768 [Gymnopilus junonius]
MAAYPNKKKSEYLRKHQSQAFEGAENPYGEAEDILVLIMGPTGVGKSTFVNQLIKGRGNSNEFQVGHDLDVCTHDMQSIRLPSNPEMDFPGHSKRDGFFIAVDTPGLGDTYENAADVLTRIAKWLALSYSPDSYPVGVCSYYIIVPKF